MEEIKFDEIEVNDFNKNNIDLKKECSVCYMSTKISIKKSEEELEESNKTVEIEDIKNREDLVDMLLEISHEYDELKKKYDEEVSNFKEKEKEYIKKIQSMNKISNFDSDDYDNENQYNKRRKNLVCNLENRILYSIVKDFEEEEDEDVKEILRKEIKQKELEIMNIKTEYESIINSLEENHTTEINEINNDIYRMQEELKIKDYDKNTIRDQLKHTEENLFKFEEKVSYYTKEISNLNQEMHILKSKYESEISKLKRELKEMDGAMKEMNEKKFLFDELNLKYNNLVEKKNYLVNSLSNLENEKKSNIDTIEKLKNEISYISKDNNDLKIENLSIREELAICNLKHKESLDRIYEEHKSEKISIIRNFENEKNMLIDEIEKLKQGKTGSNVKIKKSLISQVSVIENLTLQHYLGEDSFDEANESVESIKDVNAEMKQNLEYKDKLIDEIKKENIEKINDLNLQITNLIIRIDTLVLENINLKSLYENVKYEKDEEKLNHNLKMKKIKDFLVKQGFKMDSKSLNYFN